VGALDISVAVVNILSQVDALETDQNGFMHNRSRQSPDVATLLNPTVLNSIQVQSIENVLGDQSQSIITESTVNEDGAPVSKVVLKHALSLMTIPDINLTPTMMQNSFSQNTASMDQNSHSTLLSVKQVGNRALDLKSIFLKPLHHFLRLRNCKRNQHIGYCL
jgi:hypothetical protein